MSVRTSVMIAGAGPTGLTLACDLARRGVAHRLVEKSSEPARSSRAKGLQPRTLEVFDDLGVVDAVRAAGGDYPPFRAHIGPLAIPAGRMSPLAKLTSEVPYPNLWMVPQWRTEEILRERLEALGGHVELGVKLGMFQQDDAEVRMKLETDHGIEEVTADYLVGTDGGHSSVRSLLGIELHGHEMKQDAPVILADLEIDGLDRRVWHVWPLAKGCLMTLCPLPGTSFFQMAAPLRRGVAVPELTEAGIGRFVETALGVGRVRIASVGWVSSYRPHARMADRFRVGRVFIAGDAAHVHPPSGGQGLNTGVQDAYNLGWKLEHALAGATDALLESYDAERRPIAASVLGMSKRLYGKKSAKRGSETQQLRIGYREGPLSKDERVHPGRLRAGDRAPDARCEDESGAKRRLFDVFRGPHFTLLVFGDSARDAVAACAGWKSAIRVVRLTSKRDVARANALIDTSGDAYASYGATLGSLALVEGSRDLSRPSARA